ncbi:hypothetical protein AVEN_208686-1 [Araneus ventricosus]|uniref:Uncharacterized protein n=1 Tax=Araneus ventricosus TaxID=182803 RepID=A0A4Y2N074_ARAVE|nr:hypothetical protein AVEN_208686-1 [Araneus ventricosus]
MKTAAIEEHSNEISREPTENHTPLFRQLTQRNTSISITPVKKDEKLNIKSTLSRHHAQLDCRLNANLSKPSLINKTRGNHKVRDPDCKAGDPEFPRTNHSECPFLLWHCAVLLYPEAKLHLVTIFMTVCF